MCAARVCCGMLARYKEITMNRARGVALLSMLLWALIAPCLAAVRDNAGTPYVAVPGHVLDALGQAVPVTRAKSANPADALTITLTLRRADEGGFQRYLTDVYDQSSATF